MSDRSPKAPTPAMALTVARAAAALDMSEDNFREHVAPELRWIRRGRKRVVAVLGELMALLWQHVDLAAGIIRVERGWDDRVGVIELKSQAGAASVPIIPELRDRLIDHRLLTGRDGGLVFGRDAVTPFGRAVSDRADAAWAAAGLDRITLHECRHTFASLMIAAGVNAKALSTFMRHANISVTLDLYGHLMPGSDAEAAGLLDAYLTAQHAEDEDRARAGVR